MQTCSISNSFCLLNNKRCNVHHQTQKQIETRTVSKVAPDAVVAFDTVNNRDSTCSSGIRHGVDLEIMVLWDLLTSTSFAAPDHDDAFFFTVCLC